VRIDRLARVALLAIAALVISCARRAELVIELLTVPASVGSGEPFSTHSRVCNQGDAPSDPAYVDFALKPLSPPGPELTVGGRGVPPLEPGQCHSQESMLVAPAGQPDGSHRLLGQVTGRNQRHASAVFGIGYLPDLGIEQLAGPPSVAPGGTLEVNGLVCNRGTVWAPGAGVSLYLSSDAQLVGALGGDPVPDFLLGNAFVPGLAPGACLPFEVEASAWVPAEGLYQLGAIVDEANAVSELVEDDNALLMDEIAIGWMADLVVASLAAPNTTPNGALFEVDGVVCNQGTLPSPPSQLTLYFSEDGVIEPPGPGPMPPKDFPLGPLPVPPLAPGACHTQHGSVPANAPSDGAWTLGAIVDEFAVIEEFFEANNAFAGPLMGVGFGPDLVVEAIDAPPSAGEFAEFEVSARVCNRGTTHADPSQLRLFHSSDAVLDALPFGDDPEIGLAPVVPLPPGACTDTVVNATAGSLLAGPVTVIALADALAQLEELLEMNNESAGPVMGIGWKPDLVVARVDAPASVHPGSPFDVTALVCNQGTQPSPPTQARLYHSVDALLAGIGGPPPFLDWYAGEIPVPHGLMPGACTSLHGMAYSDPGAQGAYHLGAIVDEPGFVDELIEANNSFVGPLSGVGFGPDLVVTQLAGPPTALPDGPLELDFEVCNQGTVSSPPAQVSFYDSADAVIEGSPPPAPGSDRWLGSAPVPGLAPGGCHAASAPAWLPSGELGERKLGAIADEWNVVVELVEANNAFAGPVLGIGSGPDLVVTRLLAPPSVQIGNPFDLDTQVCNQGTISSPGAQLSLYLSSDAEVEGSYFAPGPDPWLAFSWVPPLAPGACHDELVNVLASVTAEGPWYVGGIVDEGLHLPELVESNNARLGDLLGVGFGPDLVITTLAGPSSAPAGASFFIDVEACNQGTAFSPPSKLILYHSEDLEIDGIAGPPPLPFPDAVLTEVPLPGLAPASCHLESKSVVASIPGAGFLAATVDEDQLVPELVETNNERLGDALEVTGPP